MTENQRKWAIEEIEANILPDACDEVAERALVYAIEALSPPERPKGRWIETGYYDNHYNPIYECSVCRENVADYRIHAHKFCLHCGADMMAGEEE